MDTEAVRAEFFELARQIQTLDKSDLSPEAEATRRRLWRDLEILKMDIADSTRKVTDESKEVRLTHDDGISRILPLCIPKLTSYELFRWLLNRNLLLHILNWPRCCHWDPLRAAQIRSLEPSDLEPSFSWPRWCFQFSLLPSLSVGWYVHFPLSNYRPLRSSLPTWGLRLLPRGVT